MNTTITAHLPRLRAWFWVIVSLPALCSSHHGQEADSLALVEMVAVEEIPPRFIDAACESLPTIKDKKNCADQVFLALLYSSIRYPEDMLQQKVEGKVILQFHILPDGRAEGLQVARSLYPSADAEAKRVMQAIIEQHLWTPGFQGEKAVKVLYNLPIKFYLPQTQKKKRKRKK